MKIVIAKAAAKAKPRAKPKAAKVPEKAASHPYHVRVYEEIVRPFTGRTGKLELKPTTNKGSIGTRVMKDMTLVTEVKAGPKNTQVYRTTINVPKEKGKSFRGTWTESLVPALNAIRKPIVQWYKEYKGWK